MTKRNTSADVCLTLAEVFFLLLMCMVVEGLNLIRQAVWKQALDPILAAVLDRLIIIPAFESEHTLM